jgi:glycosyltransferase involved in cell wall biosynthesis
MKTVGNIFVFTQWSFKDALVQTYTLPYVDIIRSIIAPERKIFLLTSEQSPIALSKEETDKINEDYAKKNMKLLPQSYRRFGIKKMIGLATNLFRLYFFIKKNKITIIHAVGTPAGGLAYILSKVTGAEFIVDSYEPHAEAMVENGTWKKNGIAYKILFGFEKRQTTEAAALVATTAGMRQYALEKFGVKVKNFFVKPACVDMIKFYPREKDAELLRELRFESKVVCVYAGKLGGIYFKKEIFDFIKSCYDHWNDDFRFLMLTNASREEIEEECKRVGLPEYIVINKFVFHNEIPAYLSLGDFALNPVKPVPTKRFCTSIKDGEYWAMGLPIVISPNISDDSDIIEQEEIGIVMDFADKDQFEPSLAQLDTLLQRKNDLKEKIRNTGQRYRSFDIAENIYRKIYGN